MININRLRFQLIYAEIDKLESRLKQTGFDPDKPIESQTLTPEQKHLITEIDTLFTVASLPF